MAFTSLNHHIDLPLLREAARRTRKDGAPGVDGQTWDEYSKDLEGNLQRLLDLFKSGQYRAPHVRRVHIPKGSGLETRPIGVPTLEDKILQRAVTMILSAIYEQDFLECSYGFRPRRDQHRALNALNKALWTMGGGWVLEVDIRKFFDTLDHGHLRSFLDSRVRDGVMRRMIDRWLKAGVLESGQVTYPDEGTPQGGVISPLLSNIYLHEVLDRWFEEQVKPVLRGRAQLIRFADDFVMVFEQVGDAHRVHQVLPKRFAKFGLTIHSEKTKLVDFRRPGPHGCTGAGKKAGTFDLLGFTHYWGKARNGMWVIKRKTMRSRLVRSVRAIRVWCRRHYHRPVRDQSRTLGRKLQGHYNYYGVTHNFKALKSFYEEAKRIWKWALGRRSQKGYVSWERLEVLMGLAPLPKPRIVRPVCYAARP